ncbi:MAG: hypothetical protein ACK4YO_02945, partial [Candidatus Altarchaeaceae archaeon]
RCVIEIENPPQVGKQAWEAKLNGESCEVVFTGEECETVTPHINKFIEDNHDKKISIEITDKEWPLKNKNFIGKFKEKRNFRTYRTISLSPNMFMFLIPSSKVVEIIKEVKEKYTEQFGKVYGKLPLNIGVVFFKRRTPLYACLDSAKRFIHIFKDKRNKKQITFSIEQKEIIDDKLNIKIKKGDKETDKYLIKIPFQLGDGTKDYYHPFVRVSNSDEEKHILYLNEGDKIQCDPSYFDFQFLDTSARRFDITLDSNTNKRNHDILGVKGARPYYLEDIDNFEKLWKILNDKKYKITSTKINNLYSLLTSKIYDWNIEDLDNPEFKNIVEDSIKNILEIGKDDENFKFIGDSVSSGLFFDVIELYLKIMKQKLK